MTQATQFAGFEGTSNQEAIPFAGEALKDAGDLLAHDLQLWHFRVCMYLLHQLHQANATCELQTMLHLGTVCIGADCQS